MTLWFARDPGGWPAGEHLGDGQTHHHLFEQTFRYGYALDVGNRRGMVRKLLKGRSARIIVTMGMPAAVYRYYFRGSIEKPDARYRERWLGEIRELGRRAK